jgi:hypothetical protein
MKTYKPNFGIVELCLTYRCNVKCDNCSNLCTQAPFSGDLSADMVREFIADSDRCGHTWGMITLHGGEPVLAPEIFSIAEVLAEYRGRTGCKLWLLTNNSSNHVRRLVTKISLDYNIPLGVSTKKGKNNDRDGNPIEYVAVNESPEDLGIEHERGCFQTENCGICYNYLGYFPCSPMAAAARVFGYRGLDSISKLTESSCLDGFDLHCRHCGFSAPQNRRVVSQTSSKTWKDALELYNNQLQRKDVLNELVGA